MQKKSNLMDLIVTALMIALVFISGNIIKIPTFGGFVHIGDCTVLLCAVVLNKKNAAFAGAIGMALVDIYSGYILWAPFTFIIKGLMAYIAGALLEKSSASRFKSYLLSFLSAGIFMVLGYFIAGVIVARFLSGDVNNIISGIIFASKDIIGNIIQVSTGIILALPLSQLILSAKRRTLGI